MDLYEDFESLTDEELAMRFFEGHMAAFNVLSDRYRKDVTKCCCRVVRDQDVAEEVAQETFMRVALKIRYFLENSERRNFGAWIRTMAHRLAINRWHREKRSKSRRTNLTPSQLDESQSSNEPDPAELLEVKECHQILHKAADKLLEPTKTYFAYYYFKEIPKKEIAKTYELSLHQVEYHLKRGRAIVEKEIFKIMLDHKNRN